MIKAIIFDKDGVLIESEEFYLERRLQYLEEKGITPASTDLNDFIGNGSDKNWKTIIPHDEELREKLAKDFIENYMVENPIDYDKHTRKNIVEIFREIKSRGFKIAIASAAAKNDIKDFIDAAGIEEYLDTYVSGRDCKNNKPYPDVYLKTMEILDVNKDEVMIVEDSITGLKAAKASGAKVIAFEPTKYTIDQSLADYKIKDLSEILNYLDK